MGQTLSEPVTEKESAHCQNDELAVSKYTELRIFYSINILLQK